MLASIAPVAAQGTPSSAPVVDSPAPVAPLLNGRQPVKLRNRRPNIRPIVTGQGASVPADEAAGTTAVPNDVPSNGAPTNNGPTSPPKVNNAAPFGPIDQTIGAPPKDATSIQPFETGIDYQPVSPRAKVTFNLEDADLPELVRLISSITGRRFIISNKARNIKATVYAPTKVTAAEAYRAFLSILEMNGLAVVPSGRYLKIVESTGIQQQPISTYTEDGAVPVDDRYITRLHQLSNVGAEDVATLISRFATREGAVTAYAPTNTLIITDTGSSIERMLRIIRAIDVAHTGEQVWIEPIHYANATELAERLQEIFPVGTTAPGGGGGGGGRNANTVRPITSSSAAPGAAPVSATTVGTRTGETRVTKIIADERTNSLIMIATERAYLRMLELIRQLDVALEGSGRVHVHYLQHGDSEEIATTLSSFTGGVGGRTPGRGGQAAAGGNAGGGAAAGPDLFEGQIKITAHKASNALVITASLHDYASLKKVIEELDAPRRQVFVEAVVMELSVNRSRNLGLSFHTGIPDFPTDGSLGLVGSNASGSIGITPDSLTGLALGVQGPAIAESTQLIGFSLPSFGVVLNALANSGDANILSTPHIIAMDNEEAEISVGANVPLQTSGLSSSLGALGGAAGANSAGAAGAAGLLGLAGGLGGLNVPRQDVGTTIKITPHINESDEVRLEINEEISEAAAETEGALGVRSLSRRTAKTQMVVRDQQTVVIGGLMRDGVRTAETKIPILGDLPLLGMLFRKTTHSTEKTNLLLFLTPYIIRDASDLRAIYERKMRERQEFLDRYFVFGDKDYEAPKDYSRTRGLVGEIMRELAAVSEETKLAEEIAAKPVDNHTPRAAVGAVDPSTSSTGTGTTEVDPGSDEGMGEVPPPMDAEEMATPIEPQVQ